MNQQIYSSLFLPQWSIQLPRDQNRRNNCPNNFLPMSQMYKKCPWSYLQKSVQPILVNFTLLKHFWTIEPLVTSQTMTLFTLKGLIPRPSLSLYWSSTSMALPTRQVRYQKWQIQSSTTRPTQSGYSQLSPVWENKI